MFKMLLLRYALVSLRYTEFSIELFYVTEWHLAVTE